jgi:para-nitrobenzyl esterase
MTETPAPHAERSWLGTPYATAERFRRPTLLPFDPALPYDQKGPRTAPSREHQLVRSG